MGPASEETLSTRVMSSFRLIPEEEEKTALVGLDGCGVAMEVGGIPGLITIELHT